MNSPHFLLPLTLLVAATLTGGFEFPSEERKDAAPQTPVGLNLQLQSSAGNPFTSLNATDENKQLTYGYHPRRQFCNTFGNQYGYCTWLTQCPGFQEILYQGLFPPICSWTEILPVICCSTGGSYPGLRPGPRPGPYPRPLPPVSTERPTYPNINQKNLQPIVDKWKESYSASDPNANAVILQDEKLEGDLEERFFIPPGQGIPNRQSLKPNENPWLASIGYYESRTSVRIVCEGTIISHLYVLTAAHCTKVTISVVRMGHTNLFTDTVDQVNVIEVQVEKVEVHSQYVPGSPYYDIAVVKLQKRLTFSERITAACLPRPNFQAADSAINLAVSYGDPAYGDGTYGNALEINTKALKKNVCRLNLQSQNQDFHSRFREGLKGLLCVPQTRQLVSGQSSRRCKLGGSPLLARESQDSPVVVTGLLIESSTCSYQKELDFQLYTDVGEYQDFLQQFIQEV